MLLILVVSYIIDTGMFKIDSNPLWLSVISTMYFEYLSFTKCNICWNTPRHSNSCWILWYKKNLLSSLVNVNTSHNHLEFGMYERFKKEVFLKRIHTFNFEMVLAGAGEIAQWIGLNFAIKKPEFYTIISKTTSEYRAGNKLKHSVLMEPQTEQN